MVDLSNGRGWINPGPAASIARIDKALGRPLHITEAGRSFAQQEAFYNAWLNGTGNYALSPYAPSIHQVGAAIDTGDWGQYTWLLNEHGWFQTVFWGDGSLREGWHFEYDASRDQHINDPAAGGNTFEEDDMITYINVQGKGGSHRAGVFAVMRDNAGNWFAKRFTFDTTDPELQTLDAERLASWQKTMRFFDL